MSMTTEGSIPDGVHANVPAEEYHRHELGVASNTSLKLIRRSPAHYKAWVDGELEIPETAALRFGRAFHCALLEPDRFEAAYPESPKFNRRTKMGKAEYEAWTEQFPDAMPADDLATIRAMVAAVKRHPLASQMIRDGQPELTLSWKDAETGLKCKSRLDYYVRELAMIVDAKSTEDASWEEFRKDVARYGYHVQDALYRSAASALDMPVQHFVLLAVEKSPPYAVAPYTLDAAGIGRGYAVARRDMDTLAHCLKTNRWPGYPETITELDLPPWAA